MVWSQSTRTSSQSSLAECSESSALSDYESAPGSASSSYVPLIDRINQRIESKDGPFFSLEFFPPRTKAGAVNLITRFDRMRCGGPLFCDITWHPAGNVGEDSETSSMTIAGIALNYCGLDVMLHITCVSLTQEDLDHYLERAKASGIRNILALRGDINPQDKSAEVSERAFPYAADLVRYIRENYGEYFTIGVAGYPTGHPEADSYNVDLEHLKAKADAGAHFIITQLFFEADTFINFVKDCRKIGITIPILAGIMPIQSYDSLRHITKLSKLEVPQQVTAVMESVKDNDEAILQFGIDVTVEMCRKLIESNVTPGLHFYTLNRELATTTILKKLGMWNKSPQKPLPWLAATNHRRCSEDVRPIFWSSRPKSYLYRTQTWDEFPNGRWGHSASPAFGELKDYYLFIGSKKTSDDELKQMWGCELRSERDVWEVFYCYLSKELNVNGCQVTKIPWNEEELSAETSLIAEKLACYNRRGVLTINSQPNVNGADSTDPVHGWGAPNGYVYQKAYVEFFTCFENVEALKTILKNYPNVNYHILNRNGIEDYSNCSKKSPIAVTWGVFPGTEIIQPTVVDPVSFRVWKDEAFSLWTESWAKIYPENSFSKELLTDISNTYYLVNLVDNDYPKETCLWKILEEMFTATGQVAHQNGRGKCN